MKMTPQEVKRRNDIVIEMGAAELSWTLKVATDGRSGHTEGVYGWNADIYEFGQFAICTGYRAFGNRSLPFAFRQKWEKRSKVVYDKIFGMRPNGKFYTSTQRARMKYTYMCKFEKAVMAELAKQDKQKKQKKMRKAA